MRWTRSPEERFLEKVNKTDGCWLWTAYTTAEGYGRFRFGSKMVGAHRWAYEHYVGPIPGDLFLDHLCRVRNCVNPAHLEPVTPRQNSRRSPLVLKTYCPQGHRIADDFYEYPWQRGRACAPCVRARVNARAKRKREEASR